MKGNKKNIHLLLLTFLGLAFFSCKEESKQQVKLTVPTKKNNFQLADESMKKDSLILENGIKIHWLNRGEGAKIVAEDCVNIDYKVFLEDGKLIEGNHMLNIEKFPYVVGFGMQTKGWDIALQKLQVGDEVEVFIPSDLARGEKGVEGIIPPNSNNILYLKIIEKRKPNRIVDGNKVYIFEENKRNKLKFNRENTISFHSIISSPSNPSYFNSFRTNTPFTMKMIDAGTVPGLKKALNNAKKSDRMYVVVPSLEAYGSKGYLDIVRSNEPLLFNIFVMDVF